ncbi:unnamed protein product [Adineta steineri]|uniref:LamG-like jellyroll fold domain-containing protein n=1 Tax=Adineta steineri TaxID=433720 RepID=A0A819ZSM2_9BILA|nr:unnamed protein product [Adineta steineri]
MENNVVDSISNLSGTAINSPTYTSSGINGGYNLQLIGSSNQYITISTYQSFVSTSFTVEMWIYPTSLSSGTSYGLFSQYQAVTQDHNLYLILSGGNLKMGFWNDDVTSGTTLSTNAWYHVAFVYDYSSQTQIIYLNGVQDISRSPAGPYLGASGAINIGNYFDGSNHTFDGYIDQVTLYMNARSASDILSDATLTTWHSFDCGISYDSGPNRINGTSNNVTLASGRVGQGLSYTSSSSYYQLYGFPILGTSNHAYSISLWIRRRLPGGGTLVHVSAQSNGGGWCTDFMGFSSSGNIVGSIWDGTNSDVVGPVLSTNVWVHVATTFSTTNGVRLYVNGSLIGSTGAMAYAASGTLNTVILGNARVSGCATKSIISGTLYGYLDEFRLYSRELTAREISALTKETCSDGIMNGDETDIDCGGSCVACAVGQKCILTKDCDNVKCTNGICASATCNDTIKNNGETDVDCGGSNCSPCGTGKACSGAGDCGTSPPFSGFLGNGDGTLRSQISYSTGQHPMGIAVADLNNDTHIDIVVANYYNNYLSVFLGCGNGSFTTATSLTTDWYVTAVAVADLNRDGRLDIVATTYYETLNILFNIC